MKNPVRIIESVKTLIQVAIAWVVLMGFWQMTPEQQALTITLGIAIVNLFGAVLETQQTTPLAEPKAADGEALVRAGGSSRSALKKV